MTVKIRIMGTREECEAASQIIAYAVPCRSISKFYPNRGKTIEGRVYVELDV